MKVRMSTVGKYSWDGKTVIVRTKNMICESIPDSQDKIGDREIHEGVIKQWIKSGVCKEVKAKK